MIAAPLITGDNDRFPAKSYVKANQNLGVFPFTATPHRPTKKHNGVVMEIWNHC